MLGRGAERDVGARDGMRARGECGRRLSLQSGAHFIGIRLNRPAAALQREWGDFLLPLPGGLFSSIFKEAFQSIPVIYSGITLITGSS